MCLLSVFAFLLWLMSKLIFISQRWSWNSCLVSVFGWRFSRLSKGFPGHVSFLINLNLQINLKFYSSFQSLTSWSKDQQRLVIIQWSNRPCGCSKHHSEHAGIRRRITTAASLPSIVRLRRLVEICGAIHKGKFNTCTSCLHNSNPLPSSTVQHDGWIIWIVCQLLGSNGGNLSASRREPTRSIVTSSL